MLVVIGSMPMPICNRFHERLANKGKITTFTAVPLFDALVPLNLENRDLDLQNLYTFNAENFICCFSMSISIGFGTVRS